MWAVTGLREWCVETMVTGADVAVALMERLWPWELVSKQILNSLRFSSIQAHNRSAMLCQCLIPLQCML
jgi:hypothetical protein